MRQRGRVVDSCEDAVGRSRPILVGRLKGKQSGERIGKLERGRVIDRVHLEAAKEAPSVRLLALAPERAGGERRLPAHGRKRPGERPRDLRRATAGEEEERRNHPAARRRASGLAPMPSPLVACPLHRDDSRTSFGHRRASNLVPRTSLRPRIPAQRGSMRAVQLAAQDQSRPQPSSPRPARPHDDRAGWRPSRSTRSRLEREEIFGETPPSR